MAHLLQANRIVVAAPGGASALVAQSCLIGPPAPHEVRLRQEAIGLNYHDIYVRSGAYRTMAYPGTPGIEAAGVIEDVGAAVRMFRAGQRVAYISAEYGAYADRRTMDARHLIALPDGITTETAAAMLLKGVTAHMLLTRYKPLHPGDVVLVHAAAGGVGQLLVQMGRMLGLRVLGIVGSENKAALARTLGCEQVAIRGRDDVLDMVRDATETVGVQAVFDGIGAQTAELSLAALAPFGHCCMYGQVTGAAPPIDMARLASRSLAISRPVVFHHVADRAAYQRSAQFLFDGLLDGDIRPDAAVRYPLSDISAAHTALEQGTTAGPIVAIPDRD